LPPDAAQGGAWTVWLMLGGRGAGKTRAGAEWVRNIAAADADKPARIALVGETLTDARSVMVEGLSGLMAVHPPEGRPLYEPSKRQVTWPNGAVAQLFSAEDPESLRGPQFSHAWCDELAKWRRPDESWAMLQFGLRLGDAPRQVVTTTPRPIKLIKALLADPQCAVSRVKTAANAANLAPSFLEAIVGRYRGTRLGRQELDAELLEDRPDTLFPRALIEGCRVRAAPELGRVVVAVDPPASSGPHADACGIVVAGLGSDGRAYVLADRTVERMRPLDWARAAIGAYRAHEADRIVVETNQGGDLVETVIRQVDASVPVRAVRAMRGKWLRAEPVAALYEQGRVAHVGALPALEDEMSDFGPDGLSGGQSPDRVDALVWALTELLLKDRPEPRVRFV
jgi:predicted phage terminase large subunit-like protein